MQETIKLSSYGKILGTRSTVQQYVLHLGTVYTVQIHCRTTDIYVYVYYHTRSWRLKQI